MLIIIREISRSGGEWRRACSVCTLLLSNNPASKDWESAHRIEFFSLLAKLEREKRGLNIAGGEEVKQRERQVLRCTLRTANQSEEQLKAIR